MLQLEDVLCSIENYLGRFQNLLGAGNRRYIQTLLLLTRALLKPLASDRNLNRVNDGFDTGNPSKSKPCGGCSMAIYDFLFSLNIDNINLVKLLAYIKESNIIHKVKWFLRTFPFRLSNSFLLSISLFSTSLFNYVSR